MLVLALCGSGLARVAAEEPQFPLAKVTPLSVARQMHGSAVVGKRLYVFGGNVAAGWSSDVLSAEIDGRGGLGEWKTEEPLPEARLYIGNSVEVVNNRIYIVGGAAASNRTAPERQLPLRRNVLWTSVQPDGNLAPWTTGEAFPDMERANAATCSTDEHLYLLGGNTNQSISDAILMADFAPNGAPQNWRRIGTLPMPLWFHGASVLDRRLYIWGGLTEQSNESVNSRVASAELRPDGTIGEWREETPMPSPVYSSAFCGFSDHLICLSGRTSGGVPDNSIRFARLEEGRVGTWQSLTTNLDAQIYLALGLDDSRGWVFVTAGRHKASGTDRNDHLVSAVQAFQIGGGAGDQAGAAGGAPLAGADTATRAASAGKTALIYFHSPQVPASVRFEKSVLADSSFRQLAAEYDFSSFDTSKDTSLSYKYSVFRVPSMIKVHPDGSVERSNVLQTLDDVKAFLSGKE